MKKFAIALACASCGLVTFSQSVGIGTTTPHASAAVEINSANKGLLPPRLTGNAVKAIPSPAAGLIVFDTDLNTLRYYNGNKWVTLREPEDKLTDAPGEFVRPSIPTSGDATIEITAARIGPNKATYIAGQFYRGTFVLGTTSMTNTSLSYRDIFFAKIDSIGQVLWVKVLSNTVGDAINSNDRIEDIALDATGNLYLVGYYVATLDFDPGPGVQNLVSSGDGVSTGFYAKYDNNGNWLWSKNLATNSESIVNAIITDGTSVYISGTFSGVTVFNPTNLAAFGGDDAFLCRYQASDGNVGSTGWARRIGGATTDFGEALTFYAGNILLGGYFTGTANFGGTLANSAGSYDAFFASYNTFGALNSVYTFGGTNVETVEHIATDLAGNIYIAGSYYGTADFLPGAATATKTSQGSGDAYIAKYPPDVSTVSILDIKANASDYINGLGVTDNGIVYFSALFSAAGRCGSYTLQSPTASDGEIMIGRWTGSGFNPDWIHQAGGTGEDNGRDVLIDKATGNVLFTGGNLSPTYLDFQRVKQTEKIMLRWYRE